MIVLLAAPAAKDYYSRVGFTHHPRAWVIPPGDHINGHFQNGNKQLYVTSGVGTDLPFRFGVPPEIVMLRFN